MSRHYTVYTATSGRGRHYLLLKRKDSTGSKLFVHYAILSNAKVAKKSARDVAQYISSGKRANPDSWRRCDADMIANYARLSPTKITEITV